MNSKNNIDTRPGNTPVRHIPPDYYPPGNGFWFTLPEGPDAGKKLFFQDTSLGSGTPERTIVFVHGNPESSYTYRKIIKRITRLHRAPLRIVAMDHIGFGLSDQAGYEMVSMDHAANLLHLIRHLDLQQVTLVIHDWGGPIGIGAFLREPERVSNLVILNSTVFPMPDQGYTYKNFPIPWLGWYRTPSIIPDRMWGSFAAYAIYRTPAKPLRILVEMVLFLVLSEIGILPENERMARMVYKEQFQSKMNSRSSKRLVKQSAVWGHGNKYVDPALGERDTAPFYAFIRKHIGAYWGAEGQNIGVRFASGRWDPLGKDSVIKQWIKALPQLEGHLKVFEGVGHFVEECEPDEIADIILDRAFNG